MAAPEKLTIDTPEQIALEFTLASVGSRFLAVSIDTLFQLAGFLVLGSLALAGTFVSSMTLRGLGPWVLGALLLVAFVIYYGYFALFEALWNGQTPGKRIIGLRTIDAAGHPASVYSVIVRNVVRIADQQPGILYGVGILTVLVTERSQRLGDLAAGTVVVHDRPVERTPFRPEIPAAKTHHGATKLTADEIALVETFLRRRDDLSDTQRRGRAIEIARRIYRRLELPHPDDPERFLEEIAAEYRNR